jgi:hypothetical protein
MVFRFSLTVISTAGYQQVLLIDSFEYIGHKNYMSNYWTRVCIVYRLSVQQYIVLLNMGSNDVLFAEQLS